MAALLSHGTLNYGRIMHPFFRPVQESQHATSQTAVPAAQRTPFDDTSPLEHETFLEKDPRSGEVQEVQSQCQENEIEDGQASGMKLEQTVWLSGMVVDQHDIDPNDDRRKRRRMNSVQGGETDMHEGLQFDPVNKEDKSKEIDSPCSRDTGSVSFDSSLPKNPENSLSRTLKSTSKHEVAPTNGLQSDNSSVLQQSNVSTTAPFNLLPSTPTKAAGRRSKRIQESPSKNVTESSPSNIEISSKKRATRSTPKGAASSSTGRSIKMRNGRLVSSLFAVLKYGSDISSKSDIGKKVEDILAGRVRVVPGSAQTDCRNVDTDEAIKLHKTAVHPFFQGKLGYKASHSVSAGPSETSSVVQDSENEALSTSIAPKAWKDVVSSLGKTSRDKILPVLDALWPPFDYSTRRTFIVADQAQPNWNLNGKQPKLKQRTDAIAPDDDILQAFTSSLFHRGGRMLSIATPKKQTMYGHQLVELVDQNIKRVLNAPQSFNSAVQKVRSRAQFGSNAFDRGVPAGPLSWTHDYGPPKWEDVLQPQCRILFEWLNEMKVHQIRSANASDRRDRRAATHPRKKGRKKLAGEMDDFIAHSDEETSDDLSKTKNALLITGPSGCGKTAAVFTVASQLGFEIFEIHPGTRRSAKDIFDKVGDMTQNHLVQQAQSISRSSSGLQDEGDSLSLQNEIATGKQPTMANFMQTNQKKAKKKIDETAKQGTDQQTSSQSSKEHLHKQSLILFEEVDILFEDDKSFWTGVQSLIRQSKRPVILTCNDIGLVPLEDLDLYTVITFEKQPVDLATRYLSYLAASEGHLLDCEAIQRLYHNRGQDLRATITDLNFWCQMAVGSQQGGLDWMGNQHYPKQEDYKDEKSRIISSDTFYTGLDLIPETSLDHEDLLRFTQDSLGISTLDWQDMNEYRPSPVDTNASKIQLLDEMLTFCDARSTMAMTTSLTAPLISAQLARTLPGKINAANRANIVRLHPNQSIGNYLTLRDVTIALEPIMEDNRTFPPATGRTAPSLEPTRPCLVTDVAPYVRFIICFDQRLEEQRRQLEGDLHGKKARTTRAARAALEGGNKANTRHERWFPKSLDFAKALQTGNDWPIWQSAEDKLFMEEDYETEPGDI